MKKVFDVAIGFFMVVLFLAAIGLIISSFKESRDGGYYFMYGIGCIISAFSLYGFSIIVDAAYIYIEKSGEKEK